MAARNEECAGLVFANKYLMRILKALEPNHPLHDVALREKIGRWGGFTFDEVEGCREEKKTAAFRAGSSFSMPRFDAAKPAVKAPVLTGDKLAAYENAMRAIEETKARLAAIPALRNNWKG